MERLVIDVPEEKSVLVRQLLEELGVNINYQDMGVSSYQKKLLQVSVWSEEDLKVFDESKKGFESFKPPEW